MGGVWVSPLTADALQGFGGDVSLQIVEELNRDSLQEQHAEAAAEFDVDRCDLCARVRARAHV